VTPRCTSGSIAAGKLVAAAISTIAGCAGEDLWITDPIKAIAEVPDALIVRLWTGDTDAAVLGLARAKLVAGPIAAIAGCAPQGLGEALALIAAEITHAHISRRWAGDIRAGVGRVDAVAQPVARPRSTIARDARGEDIDGADRCADITEV
jgi:hypothetical protein